MSSKTGYKDPRRGAWSHKARSALHCGRAALVLAAVSAFAAPVLYSSTAMASCSISGSISMNTGGVLESCAVTQGGIYDIAEYGGSGGASAIGYASGAEISAQFSLAAGQAFEVVTGAAGVSAGSTPASGGGGTFFVLDSSGALTPYLVAGGGGGGESTNVDEYWLGQPGQVSGNPSTESGDGGQTSLGAAGGGGYLTSGAAGDAVGGNSFVSQVAGSSAAGNGGTGYTGTYPSGIYAFGGGGGGYDGGIGGTYNNTIAGGGGTNYYNPNLATDVTQAAGTTESGTPVAGQIDFTLVSASIAPSTGGTGGDGSGASSGTSVPEPPALAVFLPAIFGLFVARRRGGLRGLMAIG